jgi:hypothetical protein
MTLFPVLLVQKTLRVVKKKTIWSLGDEGIWTVTQRTIFGMSIKLLKENCALWLGNPWWSFKIMQFVCQWSSDHNKYRIELQRLQMLIPQFGSSLLHHTLLFISCNVVLKLCNERWHGFELFQYRIIGFRSRANGAAIFLWISPLKNYTANDKKLTSSLQWT